MRRLRRSVRRSTARRLRRVLGTTCLACLLGTCTAFAQTPTPSPTPSPTPPPAQRQEDITLPGLDVRGRRDDYKTEQVDYFKIPGLLEDTPQSITVVPQQIMREEAVFSLRDALRNVTGLSLAAGEGGGAQGDNLTLRGFSARNDFYIDGVRDIGQYARDVFNLESIEVLKGPAAVMFGRGSTGGVVNQVSKAPHLTPSYIGSATVGSGPLLRGTLDINQPIGESAAFRLNALGFKDEVEGRDFAEVKRYGAAPSFSIGLGTPTRLTASYYYLQDDNVPDYGLPYVFGKPPEVGRDTWYGLENRDYEKDHVHIGTLTLEHTFNESIRLRNISRLAFYKREGIVSPPRIVGNPAPGTPLAGVVVSRTGAGREQEDLAFINQTDAIVNFATFGIKHTLVTGVELGRESSVVQRYTFTGVPTTSLVNPDPHPNLASMNRVTNFRGDTDAFSFGLYAVDELRLLQWLKVLGGVRYDHFDADFESGLTRQEFSRIDTAVSPRAALVVLPTKTQTYYFSYGTSFNPSAEALSLAANNADTEPEKTRTFEVGAKWDFFDGALGLQTALFNIQKTNARTTDPALGVQVLEGEQRVRGFEISVTGRPLPRWNVFAGYTYLDSRVTRALEVASGIPVEGKRIQNVPENTFTLWTTYDITDQWQVGGGVFYVDQRFANNVNTNVAPAYVRADITAAYRPVKPLELRVNVLNISDETYFDAVHPAHVVPGAGRTFLFTGTLRF
jgi:catecholate siderophore receptor